MRVISGSFKGKKILEPKNLKTRPLKDLTKESIFNIIFHSNKFNLNFSDAIILDLFSGVGSFGIECLSRGARKVTFIENYLGVLTVLKKNLFNLNSVKNYEIIEKDIFRDNLEFILNHKFDLIFLDPPYKEKEISKLFLKFEILNILKSESIIILHRHKNEEDILPSNFKTVEEKKYGISKISFIKYLK